MIFAEIRFRSFKPENIFNMDETGLYYRAMPTKGYISNVESRKITRGTKALKAKDRVTLLLCVNETGTYKIPPLLLGSAKKPRCFRDSPSAIPYVSKKMLG